MGLASFLAHAAVVIGAVIVTLRVERGETAPRVDTAVDQPSRNWMLRALFRPARVHGRPMRVLVEVPIDYQITRA